MLRPLKGISRSRRLQKGDIIIAGVITLIWSAFMASVDIYWYGTYVQPIFSCSASNANQQYCSSINNPTAIVVNGTPITLPGFQLYWAVLNIVNAILPIVVGVMFGIVYKNVAIPILYFMTIMLPMSFGFNDLEFYWFQSQPLPASWPWLDGQGGGLDLWMSQQLSGAQHVTTLGIYAAIATAIGGLAVAWKIGFKLDKGK